jgi:2-succinyl-5-enolpyruvyl-6-hydroxy-3-cyclohexene-1-carboxylate synthase
VLPEDTQATFAATLVDEWVRGGVRDAVVCPGSRSTPAALALADNGDIAVHVHHDERSGGFMALGLAAASGRAVVVLTTSGTATAELHPAVVEAHYAGVPLLVCTADRPPELQDVGAPQTIDQTHLYGTAVRWYSDPGVPDAASADRWRPWAARALAEATGDLPGPVQLNLPFREPLVGTPGPLPAEIGTRSGGNRTSLSHFPEGAASRRGLIVAGSPGPGAEDAVRLAEVLGWPLVAEPRSPAWVPSAVSVSHLDAILRSERAHAALQPEVILRFGPPGASRVVNEWYAASGALEIVVPGLHWSDPAGRAAAMLSGHPADVVRGWLDELDSATVDQPEGWLALWQAASDAAARSLDPALAEVTGLNEPGIARDLVAGMPAGSTVVVSSSMPIRDVERYATPRADLRVLSNRGANGIDGVVSTAVGAAVATRQPTGLLLGDLAFLHDSNGLLGIRERGIDLVCVVVDNDGGGIFSFLPQARQLATGRFEQLFGTPHGLDLVALAAAYGVTARALDPGENVEKAVAAAAQAGGAQVLVARTDRGANVDVHQGLDAAIAGAVEAALGDVTDL